MNQRSCLSEILSFGDSVGLDGSDFRLRNWVESAVILLVGWLLLISSVAVYISTSDLKSALGMLGTPISTILVLVGILLQLRGLLGVAIYFGALVDRLKPVQVVGLGTAITATEMTGQGMKEQEFGRVACWYKGFITRAGARRYITGYGRLEIQQDSGRRIAVWDKNIC